METLKKPSKTMLWTSYILQGILVLIFLMGAVQKLMRSETAVAGARDMGYPESSIPYLGITLLVSTLLYTFPKTVYFGGVMLTAWLGGAVATHVIHPDPFYYPFFPVFFGFLIWLSIWLRDNKLKEIFPL